MIFRKNLSFYFFLLLAVLFLTVLVLEQCNPRSAQLVSGENTYLGNTSCQKCHNEAYSKYLTSDHYRAMMPANDSTVMGDFNDRTYSADGVTSRFYRRNGGFFICTEGPDGNQQEYQVRYTFGHRPLQQYLVEFPGGRMQVPRVSWDVEQKKWFHQYPGQRIHYRDWLHWTRPGQNWNTMCASCHSTNLQKGYMVDADSFHTTYSGLTVGCESCHGPGKHHVDFVQSAAYAKGTRMPASFLRALDSPQVMQVNACAPCHARKTDITGTYQHNGQLLDDMIPEIPTTEFFQADGQVDAEDYSYTSFLQSKMFHRGVKCSSCHDPHSGKLVKPATMVCGQCHTSSYASKSHTGHDVSLAQVNCISCHMPGKFYMGNDYRHDHSFRVPRPDQTITYGVTNACNNCHADKSAKWASDAVVKWYGPNRKKHFSDRLIPGSKAGPEAEVHLRQLVADTSVPDIIKATAVQYLRNLPTASALKTIINSVRHKDAQVRYRAVKSLASYPMDQWRDAVFPSLSDPVRAVRIAAADLFVQVKPELVPDVYKNALSAALQELSAYVLYQADFASGNSMIGDLYFRKQDLQQAERFYLRGLRMDSLMNYVRFNLSALYNMQGRNQDALNTLLQADKINPRNDRVQYNLGLLWAELGDDRKAIAAFEKAVVYGASDPRVFYNYGLLLQKAGQSSHAIEVFRKGLKFEPDNLSLHYALAFFYNQEGKKELAAPSVMLLWRADPDNMQYHQLFIEFGLKR